MGDNKCKLIDLDRNGEIVAEGRVSSIDPAVLVHFVPLGANAVKVWVDVAYAPDARLWRPTSHLQNIEDAIGTVIAWPAEKVIGDANSSKCNLTQYYHFYKFNYRLPQFILGFFVLYILRHCV